jgi:predicted RNase H-like HicB family nuclease
LYDHPAMPVAAEDQAGQRTGATRPGDKEAAMRQVLLYRGEDGYWVAECPSLPGCVSQGQTREDALTNVREAIAGYVAALQEDGLPVPEDRLDAMVVAV